MNWPKKNTVLMQGLTEQMKSGRQPHKIMKDRKDIFSMEFAM